MLLNLTVISATVLQHRKDLTRFPNCRAKVLVEDKTFKSKVAKRTLMPVWHEKFIIPISDITTPVKIQIWHSSSLPFADFLLGESVVSLEEAVKTSHKHECTSVELMRASEGSALSYFGTLSISVALINRSSTFSGTPVAAKPESVEPGGYLSSATNLSHDILADGSKLLQVLSTKLELFVGIVDEASKIHPIACLAWNVVSSVLKAVQGQLARDVKIIDLLTSMDDLYSFLVTIRSMDDLTPILQNHVQLALKQTMECALFIQEYCGVGFAVRALKQTFDITVQRRLDGFVDTFKALHASLSTGVTLQAALISYRTLDRVDVLVRGQVLSKLNPVVLDASNRPSCLPKTRINLLQDITRWATTPGDDVVNILWLHGLAGSGKSTISTTVASFFRDLCRLGAFVFFNRDEPERSSPSRVIRTLAAQLAAFDPRIGVLVAQAIDNIPSICESPLSLQFIELIVKPLTGVEQLSSEGPIVVILDALDECGSAATREQLLSVFAEQSRLLPSFLRILITSRNETDIMNALEPAPNTLTHELDILTTSNEADITAFFRERFRVIRGKRKNRALLLNENWPGDEAIHSLVDRAAGLFVWASTACAFIDAHDPRSRLHAILHGDISLGPTLALDSLYSTALAAAGDWGDSDFVSSFQEILGTIVVSMEPLTIDIVDSLLDLSVSAPSVHTIERLGCVLSWGPYQSVRTLHPSFVDFLINFERCKRSEWFIDTTLHHRRLATRCMDLIERHLKRNFTSLTLTMSDNENMPQIPESLTYACTFWISHVCAVTEDVAEIRQRVSGFLSTRLLHWLEAMSILDKATLATTLLKQLLEWIQRFPCDYAADRELDLEAFVVNAIRFARGAAVTMKEHTLLHYHSALPYAPPQSIVLGTFTNPKAPAVKDDDRSRCRQPILQVLTGHDSSVTSVSIPEDDSRIVSASLASGLIRMCDTDPWADFVAPLLRREYIPFPVAMSPDGNSVLAGYGDATATIWDSSTRCAVLFRCIPEAPPRYRVLTVTLPVSPFGSHFLAAGDHYFARDYLWDDISYLEGSNQGDGLEATTTEEEEDTIVGKENVPRAEEDTGGSDADEDDTSQTCWAVAVWDSMLDKPVVLRRQNSGIRPAMFARDSTKVIAGSISSIVILWDLASGTPLAQLSLKPSQPQPGTDANMKTSSLFCVAVTPFNKRTLVSDDDGCCHIWDSTTNVMISSPAETDDYANTLRLPKIAHRFNTSTPVLFPPDGASFLSARRRVILTWTTEDSRVLVESHGPSEEVTSVCRSQRTAQIVLGSSNGICIWGGAFSTVDRPLVFAVAPEKDYYIHPTVVTADVQVIVFVPDLTSVCVLNLLDYYQIKYISHQQEQKDEISAACSPDSLLIVSGFFDNLSCAWALSNSVDHAAPFRHLHSHDDDFCYRDVYNSESAVKATAKKRLISGGSETATIWNLHSGDKPFTFLRGSGTLVSYVSALTNVSIVWTVGPDMSDTSWQSWNNCWARSGLFSTKLNVPPARFNPVTLENGGWIVGQSTGDILSKLLSWLSVKQRVYLGLGPCLLLRRTRLRCL